MSTYHFVTGDTGRVIERFIKDENGQAIDLSGMSVKIRWKKYGSVIEKDMVIDPDQINNKGRVTYQPVGDDFVPTSTLFFEFEITTGAGEKLTNPNVDGPYGVRKQYA